MMLLFPISTGRRFSPLAHHLADDPSPPPLRPNPGAASLGVVKNGWIRGAIGGTVQGRTVGPVAVAYIGAERVFHAGEPGRTFAQFHRDVTFALGRMRQKFGWTPEVLKVGFFTRGTRRIAYAYDPGGRTTHSKHPIICLRNTLARAGGERPLRFTLLHELTHHWREEVHPRNVRLTVAVAHDPLFCDSLRSVAGDLFPVGKKCAHVDLNLGPSFGLKGAPTSSPGTLKIRVMRHGWLADWIPTKGKATRLGRSLAALERLAERIASLSPNALNLVRIEYRGARRKNFPRPTSLALLVIQLRSAKSERAQ